MKRRNFHQLTGALLVGPWAAHAAAPSGWRMPDEGEPHRRTWMAWAGSAHIWGHLLPHVQRDLARVAQVIAGFEPVYMLVDPQDAGHAARLLGSGVTLVECPHDDLWVRDTGCVFVRHAQGATAGVDFRFNGWGRKQEHARDAQVARFMAARAGVAHHVAAVVMEGGGIEVDGAGTAIVTESCVLNPNRNPTLGRAEVQDALRQALGVEKVLWLPGIAGRDITDGHTDFYARFVRPGLVLAALDTDPASFDYTVTRRHLEILRASTDAQGRPLQVLTVQAPTRPRNRHRSREFAAGYINYYLCNGALIAPEFGDSAADEAARRTLISLFPQRQVVQVDIDAIAAGGGGIHCATQQEPL